MTDVFGPFDGINWTQDAWYRHAPKWVQSGVNGAPASSTTTGDLPITFSGLNFTIGVGRGWVRGAGFERTGTPASQAIAANTNASLSRRDRVVLRRDVAAKTVAPTLILGTASASPTAPAIQQNETGQWDQPLFSFLAPPNSGTSISGIVDERVFIDPAVSEPMVYTMANRPTSGLVTNMRIRPADDPTRAYTYNGTLWVVDGWPLTGNFGTAPAGSYLRILGGSAVVTVNSAGAFTVPLGVTLGAPPVAALMYPGDLAGSLGQVQPTTSAWASNGLTGNAFTPSGGVITNSSVRITWVAYGWSN